MNAYNKLMKLLDFNVKKKESFKNKDKLRADIVRKIIDNPYDIGINAPCYDFEINKELYKNDKIYLIPNLAIKDMYENQHLIYIKLGVDNEDKIRGFRQLDKLNSYIKHNIPGGKGYMLLSDKKYNSLEDYLDKVKIHTTRV